MWIKDTVYSLLRLESGREVTADTDLEHDLGMDSLDIANLLMEIEETYNITISLNSLPKVKTANDLIRAIVNSQEGQFRYQGLTLSGGGLCPAPTDPSGGGFLSWFMFTSNTLHQTVMTLIHPDRVAGAAVQDIVQIGALKQLHEQANHLEMMITEKDPDWLSPRRPGALGYYLGILIRWAMYLPEDPAMRFSLSPYPALRAVLAAHEAFPAARRVAEADSLGLTPFTAPEGAID